MQYDGTKRPLDLAREMPVRASFDDNHGTHWTTPAATRSASGLRCTSDPMPCRPR